MNRITFLNEPNDFGYTHESSIEYDLTATDMTFKCDINEFEPHILLQAIKQHCAGSVREWLQNHFAFSDIDSFEGGFDEWWGMSSVTMMELGLKFNFNYNQDLVTVNITF